MVSPKGSSSNDGSGQATNDNVTEEGGGRSSRAPEQEPEQEREPEPDERAPLLRIESGHLSPDDPAVTVLLQSHTM